ncbi:MAG: (2Fe-2S)-binding protein [Dehalococcoidia bacterium]|nr:(2Fe-2S)-binding protein [Dehalococcoidia bacterium]
MAMQTIHLTLNGKPLEVRAEPHETLLDLIRDRLGFTGTKKGCDEGDCGCCTVILDGKAVNSCLVLGVEADGHAVETVEGLAQGGELHPLQEAFLRHGAVQCGYCTPGMLLSARALLDEKPDAGEEDVRTAISGNLCRCTGYVKIVEAVLSVAQSGYRRTVNNE